MKTTQKCKLVGKRFVEQKNKILYFANVKVKDYDEVEFPILERDYINLNVGDELDLTLSNGRK